MDEEDYGGLGIRALCRPAWQHIELISVSHVLWRDGRATTCTKGWFSLVLLCFGFELYVAMSPIFVTDQHGRR